MNSIIPTDEDKSVSARNKIYNSLIKLGMYFNKDKNSNSQYSLSDIKVRLKLTEIFSERDTTFLQEKNKLPLKYSTEVEYKEGGIFRKYKLEVAENRLLIVRYIHRVNKSNSDNNNDSQNKASESKPINQSNKVLMEDYYYPILALDFNFITAGMTVIREQMELSIYVLGSDLVFRMRVNNKEIYDKMINAITISISTSKGAKMNLLAVTIRHNWHLSYFISNEQFIQKAKTGDMLIFRGNECPSTCQRAFTWNEYDHVVFLQKKNNGTLFLFEATSREGCKIQTWRDYIGMLWNLIYEKIVYRELLINSSQKDKIQSELEQKTEAFVQCTNRKKYDLNVCSIMCCAKQLDHEKRNQWGQSQGFSCSSLLAAAYVSLGIIPYQKGTSAYLPGQFSQKASIIMNEPFSLGPEIVIDFSS